jgi:hypothetical protein
MIRYGQVLVRPSSSPIEAFRREIRLLLEAGQEREAFGLTIGLALLTCERVEVLWERETTTHDLI